MCNKCGLSGIPHDAYCVLSFIYNESPYIWSLFYLAIKALVNIDNYFQSFRFLSSDKYDSRIQKAGH